MEKKTAYGVVKTVQIGNMVIGIEVQKVKAVLGSFCGLLPIAMKPVLIIMGMVAKSIYAKALDRGKYMYMEAFIVRSLVNMGILAGLTTIVLHVIALILAISVYRKTGGLKKSWKWCEHVTTLGWRVGHVFPFNLLAAIVCFIFSVYGWLQIPYFIYLYYEKTEENNYVVVDEKEICVMKKERAKMYEDIQFDSYAYAVDIKGQAERKLKAITDLKKSAIVGTLYGVIALIIPFFFALLAVLLGALIDAGIVSNDQAVVEKIGGALVVLAFIVKAVFHLFSFVLCIRVYKKIGGFRKAFQWSRNVTAFGWYVCPLFPIDLMVALICFLYSLYALFQLPYFIWRHYEKQEKKNLTDAEEYLKYCKPVDANK